MKCSIADFFDNSVFEDYLYVADYYQENLLPRLKNYSRIPSWHPVDLSEFQQKNEEYIKKLHSNFFGKE